MLLACVPLLIGAAFWFVGLQVFVVRRFCAYCCGLHVLGLMLAGLIVLIFRNDGSAFVRRSSTLLLLLPGMLALCVLVFGQLIWAPTTFRVTEACPPAGAGEAVPHSAGGGNRNAFPPSVLRRPAKNENSGTERIVTVHGGKVSLPVDSWPLLGSPIATDVFVYFFDFTCDNCRHLHALLEQAIS